MRTILFRIAYALMGVLACAWPLGIYQHIPLTSQTIVSIAGTTLVLLWLLDLALYRNPRLPFELLWPTALIPAIAIATRTQHALQIAGIAALFLAALHFARHRKDIERWITWTAAACLVAAIADMLYRAGYGWPTAYALPTDPSESARMLDAASAMSGSLTNSSITLLTGTMLWAAIAHRTKTRRAIAILGFLVMAAACAFHIAGLLSHVPTQPTDWITRPSTRWLLGGLAVWLLARIGAKVLVERERTPEGRYLFIAAPVIAIALVLCFATIDAMAWHAWAAALAAGYVIRDKRPAPAGSGGRFGAYAAIALIPYAAMNTSYVDQTNAYDGRNYVQDLRADYAAGELARVVQRLEFWNQRTGDSGAQDYWASQAALGLNRPEAAAAWAVRLSRGGGTHGDRQPIPNATEINSLLNRFRDYVSALPEENRGIAYEQALSAVGEATAAEMSLRQRISDANPVYEDVNRAPLENAAKFLFHDIRAFIDFSDWSVAELIAVLNLAGGRVLPTPEEVDRSWLPATVTVRHDARRVWIAAESATAREGAYGEAVNSLLTTPTHWPDEAWQIAALPFDASWQVTLYSGDGSGAPIATVTFSADGQPDILLAEPIPESLPDEPIVFIWLP